MVQQENFFLLKNFLSRVQSTGNVKAGKKRLVHFKLSDRSEHHCSNTITQCEVQINVLGVKKKVKETVKDNLTFNTTEYRSFQQTPTAQCKNG